MKKYFLVSLLFAFALSVNAQKIINDANAERRPIKSFHAIKVAGGIDLYLSEGDEAIAVSAKDAETRNYIKTEVENGVLKIWFEWKNGRNIFNGINKQLKAYVSYKKLDALSASGGCDVTVDGTITENNLIINISGGSDFNGRVNAQDLKVEASGGSDVEIAGKATRLSVDVNGGSDFSGYGLVTETTSVAASGGSDVEVTVNKELNAKASGGSDVFYKGGASVTEARSSGSSSVKKTGK
ncbi:MAG: head GIN domain-containing protein [Chitinophagaceae bacterium]